MKIEELQAYANRKPFRPFTINLLDGEQILIESPEAILLPRPKPELVITFTAPEGSDTLAFELTVTDPGGETDTDTVIVTINGPPSADAGPDQAANLGDIVTLDGTGSSDPDGDTLTYSWVQTAGPATAGPGAVCVHVSDDGTYRPPAAPSQRMISLPVHTSCPDPVGAFAEDIGFQ